MDFSAALPTFLITLREGVEAALVVGIVLACLNKAKASHLNPWVYLGIVAGLLASGLVGVLLGWGLQALGTSSWKYGPAMKPMLEGVFCMVAIAMLSWMLIWMTQQAKSLKGEIEGAVNAALNIEAGRSSAPSVAGWGVFSLIFIAVLREGFETVLFVIAQFEQGFAPALGAAIGLAGAAGIGVLLFKWGVKINIRLFFQVMGVLLLLIVSGLVISALKNFNAAATLLSAIDPQFAHLCAADSASCILGPMVWDARDFLSDRRFPGIVLKALFGYRSQLYLAQAIAYGVFLVCASSLYFQSLAGTQAKSQNLEKSVKGEV